MTGSDEGRGGSAGRLPTRTGCCAAGAWFPVEWPAASLRSGTGVVTPGGMAELEPPVRSAMTACCSRLAASVGNSPGRVRAAH